jgi:hypothetical protein
MGLCETRYIETVREERWKIARYILATKKCSFEGSKQAERQLQ